MAQVNKNKESNGTEINKIGPETEEESKKFVDKDGDSIPDQGVDKYSYSFDGFNDEFFDRQLFQESSFDPKAVSPDNARGLAQITPNTEEELKRLKLVGDDFNPFDPAQAKDAQKKYMSSIHNRDWVQGTNFEGDSPEEVKVVKTLMGYNMGPTKAVKKLNDLKSKNVDIYKSTDFVNSLNKETQGYVKRILNLNNEGKDQDYYETELVKGLNKYKKPIRFMDGGKTPIEELFNK